MKGKLWWHQVILGASLLVLTLVRLLSSNFRFGIEILWWWLGAILGFVFVFLDRFVYVLVTDSESILSLRIKSLLSGGKIVQGLAATLEERQQQKQLVMRSVLFLLIWIGLAVWTVTSVANTFSRGLVLGIGLHLLFDLVWDLIYQKSIENWLWQVKLKMTPGEIKFFTIAVSAIMALLIFNL